MRQLQLNCLMFEEDHRTDPKMGAYLPEPEYRTDLTRFCCQIKKPSPHGNRED